MNADNDITMVYANDTVDFGTIDTLAPKDGSSAHKSDGTQSVTDSDNTGDDKDDVRNKYHLPQHANAIAIANSNKSAYVDLHHQHPEFWNAAAGNSTIIDNRKLVYIPVRLACGVYANCSPDVLKHCPMVLRSIQADLVRAFSVLPVSVHSLLRRTNLWLNYNGYAYGPIANPRILRHVTTHHHPAWLIEWGRDTPQKAMGIEIYSCLDFQKMRLHWNGSGLLLHELCHLIHQCCLEDGLENRTVEALYERADASGRYEKVLRRDWAGRTTTTAAAATTSASTSNSGALSASGSEAESSLEDLQQPADSDLAYAMVDPKEFFAELSVAYFCNAYRTLDKADPTTMEASSPPLLHPDATERVESLILQRRRELASDPTRATNHPDDGTEYFYQFLDGSEPHAIGGNNHTYSPGVHRRSNDKNNCCWVPFPPVIQFVRNFAQRPFLIGNGSDINYEDDPQLYQWLKLTDPVFRERAYNRNCANTSHCNKFYPFTRGQLKRHDPELFEDLHNLWREVSMWDDPFASVRTKKRMARACCRRC